MPRYRLYLDESGDHTYNAVADPDRRYLGLTGIVVEAEHYRRSFHPDLEALKQAVFPHNPDDAVILVRNWIVSRRGTFGRLRDAGVNAEWEAGLLQFLTRRHMFNIFSVVIDKQAHQARYGRAAFHPYHYCLTVLLERYRGFLTVNGAKGDVLAESRGGVEDTQLRAAYQRVYHSGTGYLNAQQFQDVLTSKELKLKRKEQNIAGLQIADLIAYPSKVQILQRHDGTLARPPSRFTAQLNGAISWHYNQHGRVFLG